MKHLPILLVMFFGWMAVTASAQDVPPTLWLDNLEELAQEEEEPDWEEELRLLEERQEEPLNLNTATRQQLECFPFLSDSQIEHLLAYLYLHGEMETIYELQLVEEMDKQTIRLLLPFVCVKKAVKKQTFPAWGKMLKQGRHEVNTRLDYPLYTRRGYQTAYLGPKPYHSLRYRFHYGDYLQAGLTAEKDAGEPFFARHNAQGYDHYAYYLQLRHKGWLDNLLLGCYRLHFGQGLVMGSSFHTGKSYTLSTSDYKPQEIRPQSSVDEFNYLHGIALTARLSRAVNLSVFCSHRTMDGTVEEGSIVSINRTGPHRTRQEADRKDAFSMQLAGAHLSYAKERLRLGLTGLYYDFSRPYAPDLPKYAKYHLTGNRLYNLAADYSWRAGRFSLSGEVAKGKHGWATLNRLFYRLSSSWRFLLVHRYYAHDYWAFYARSFAEGSEVRNENGWYLAAEATPFSRWRFFVSADFFSSPWWRYRVSKPSQGVDLMLQAAYAPTDRLGMYLNYRVKRKERDITGTGGEQTTPTLHHRWRYRLEYKQGIWTSRTTLDYNRFSQQTLSPSQGFMLTQMASCTLPSLPLSATVQGSYFHTDDYDSRLYAYEKGMLHTFYTPSFYGHGFRYSLHLRYDHSEHLMLMLKFGQTIYTNRNTIGSGNDLISSNRKGDLQLQIRLKW
ncbi:MAG: helix-hairpin-helix domain-containing protein [Bacteroides sp.]|nr:helix-hairpin-helix domain-containing protein [Bacteroides sp.]